MLRARVLLWSAAAAISDVHDHRIWVLLGTHLLVMVVDEGEEIRSQSVLNCLVAWRYFA